MGLFTVLGRIFRGKKAETTKGLYKTESYWNGLEADLDKQVDAVKAKYSKASAVYKTKAETLGRKQKHYDEMKRTAEESRELYKETQVESHKTNAMNAFNKMNEIKVTIDVLNEELATLKGLVDELKTMKDNAVHIANSKKAEILKAKARVEFSDTMQGLTDGIKEFTTMEIEGAEEVNIAYHENVANLEEINSGIVKPVHQSADFDNFMSM